VDDREAFLEKRARLQVGLENLKPLTTIDEEIERTVDILNNFYEHYAACQTVEEQSNLIRLIIEEIHVRDDELIRIMFTNPFMPILHYSEREGIQPFARDFRMLISVRQAVADGEWGDAVFDEDGEEGDDLSQNDKNPTSDDEVSGLDLRDRVSLTRHNIEFPIPLPISTQSDHLNPDKAKLREIIFDLRSQGWSFRQIAQEVGLHWTRIQQLVNGEKIPGNG
jgi:hypothetical protein